MSDPTLEPDPDLVAAHETVEIELPRWVLEMLIASADAVADAENAPDDLRRDCRAASKIAETRLVDPDA